MLPWLAGNKIPQIAVIGDIILDEYIEGNVQRISAEAPVPILNAAHKHNVLGGAGNTARNVKSLGGIVDLYGVCGEDSAGEAIEELLQACEINSSGVLVSSERPTSKKTRLSSGHQQMLRLDWEVTQGINSTTQEKIWRLFQQKQYDAVIISDYAKGALPTSLLKQIFTACGSTIPCIVDPKGLNYARYSAASLLTPNRKEACLALNLDENKKLSGEELGKALIQRFQLNGVLVTLGAEGMVYVSPEGKTLRQTAQTREVFDVSGAGDTVAAVVALTMAANCPMEQALYWADLAAGRTVEKWGTQAVEQNELISLHQERLPQKANKLVDKLSELRKQFPGMRIVFTNGCFDLFHRGHLHILEQAKLQGDILVVGVNDDASLRKLKGNGRPLQPLEQRVGMLNACNFVDYIVPFSEPTPKNLIKALKPNVLVKGADYQEHEIVGAEEVKAYGGTVHRVKRLPGLSTSELIAKIQNIELEK